MLKTLSGRKRMALLSLITISFFTGCKHPSKQAQLFTALDPDEIGIHFVNQVEEADSTKSFINEFGYMGGGVGIGDFNNDGLKDIFFTGNQVSCRLYLNRGNNKFEDITEKAGLTTNLWATGVSVADVNNDGFDDIYVCSFGKDLRTRAKNLLFINQGRFRPAEGKERGEVSFREEAGAYGLADSSYSSQAAFFDYDKDGDLDVYIANYRLDGPSANTIVPKDTSGRSTANDRLYQNVGDTAGVGHPVFRDATLAANIKDDGYGLGVMITDVNGDTWPDIYVTDDFLSNDLLWLNNKNGTFSNCIRQAARHQSYSSMGVDAADINNDGLPDLVTLDMLPENNERKKTSFSFMNYERYQTERMRGYEPAFMRNMLQLNNGVRYHGDTAVPAFSEIGQLAGISATDWSWSVLLADFDNDGWKDMHITNGIGRDFIDVDFLDFSNQIINNVADQKEQQKTIREKLASLDHVNLKNYLYINNRDYTFNDVSEAAGIDEPSMSNGAAYVDLDNDGDLDLVVNNINKEAFVFRNNTIQKKEPAELHFLKVVLKGEAPNRRGFGARVCLYQHGQMQMQEEFPVRGYFSSVDQDLLFGLGKEPKIDSVVVVWPDGRRESKTMVAADTSLVLFQESAGATTGVATAFAPVLFTDITASSGIQYRHVETEYNDFANQRLLPQKFSQLGPFLTTGDVNGDGTTDFFVGGAINFSGKLFMQGEKRFFRSKNIDDSTKQVDDMDCLLFDADGDRDLDLIVTCGDVQQPPTAPSYQPKLFINDGKGKFALKAGAVPASVKTIAGTVSAGDYDGDGDLDLFIGGRVSAQYPVIPHSFLLQNNGGVFADVTTTVCPSLQNAGMITSSIWTDMDGDKKEDLMIAGEWMSVRFFKNRGSKLEDVTAATGLPQMNGMWRSLAAADIDKDGDMDLVAGNLGANCTYHTTPGQPMELYAKDMDGNGSMDPVFFYYIKDRNGKKRLFPGISRAQFADQVPAIKKQFLQAKDYSNATFEDVFPGSKKEGLQHLTCTETRSCFFENLGGGKFKKHVLPVEAQFAPINAIVCEDIDNDGYPDLLLAGNEYQTDVITGRYDASYGLFLKGTKGKSFEVVPPSASGFVVDGDVRDMAILPLANKEKVLLVAVNNDSLRVFRVGTQRANKR